MQSDSEQVKVSDGFGEIVNQCHACRDGECFWEQCPQLRDNEPAATGRHCPLDVGCGRCGHAEENCSC